MRLSPWRDHQSKIVDAYRAQIMPSDPNTLWELGYLKEFVTRVTASPG